MWETQTLGERVVAGVTIAVFTTIIISVGAWLFAFFSDCGIVRALGGACDKDKVPQGAIMAFYDECIEPEWKQLPESHGRYVLSRKSSDEARTGGSSTITLLRENLPAHDHSINFPSYTDGLFLMRSGNDGAGKQYSLMRRDDGYGGVALTEATIGNSGDPATPIPIEPIYISLYLCQKM